MSSIAVVIPTVRGREDRLAWCLEGLAAQRRPADEIAVVRERPSPVTALIDGWRLTSSECVAFLDDDAVPDRTWLERLDSHLADPRVGAVGGRVVHVVDGRCTAGSYDHGPVAALSWYGRTMSRLGDIPTRRIVCEASFLPGSNMCVRREALGEIDPGLAVGMAPGFELAICQRLHRSGFAVRFDSEIVVTHHPAPRPGAAERNDAVRYAREYSRVMTYGLLRELSWPRKLAFAAYFGLVGQRHSPGLALAPACLRGESRRRLAAAWQGKWEGARACVSRS